MFLDCPAYLDQDRAVRCGLPAEVRCRFIMRSSDGHIESAMIRCPAGHWFSGPNESRTWESTATHNPGTAGVAPPYYLGGPASVWITAISPRRRGTASTDLMAAVRP